MNPQRMTAEEVAAAIPDGAVVATGGTIHERKPVALCRALAASGKKIDLVTFLAGEDATILLGAGALRSLTATWCAADRAGVDWRESSEWLLLTSLRAAAIGLPFLPSRAGLESDLGGALKTVADPYSGAVLAAHPALRPDFALIHAWRADAEGNVQLPHPPPHLWDVDLLLARAAVRCVVSVDEIVPVEVTRRDSHLTRLNRVDVDFLVAA